MLNMQTIQAAAERVAAAAWVLGWVTIERRLPWCDDSAHRQANLAFMLLSPPFFAVRVLILEAMP